MILNADESQVVMIDFSSKFLENFDSTNQFLGSATKLAQIAKLLKVPVWGVEQNPDFNGPMHEKVRYSCRKIIPKLHFDACEEGLIDLLRVPTKNLSHGNARSLPKHLQKKESTPDSSTILLAGCETHISVLQTAMGLIDMEFDVCLVIDASASATARNHDCALDRLAGVGVELVTLEMVAYEWLSAYDHPSFSDVIKLLEN